MKTAASPLAIGDRLIYDGRPCLIHGFTPMSVEPARVYLTAPGLARIFLVQVDELGSGEPANEAA